jgi:hypothetical protein
VSALEVHPSELMGEIERLQTENWQLKQACGYPIPADKETINNPFKCGMCDARSQGVNDALGPCTQAELDQWEKEKDTKTGRILLMWKERAEKAEAALAHSPPEQAHVRHTDLQLLILEIVETGDWTEGDIAQAILDRYDVLVPREEQS